MTDDIETRVLNQFKRRLRDSHDISTATQEVLSEDLNSMSDGRSDLLNRLIEERRS